MPYTSRCAARYGIHVTTHTARRVWAAVTRCPQASLRDLAGELDIGYGTVGAALRLLRDAGYIEFDAASVRARRIVIPFIVTGPEA